MHFMTAEPIAVREHYRSLRGLAYNNSKLAAGAPKARRKLAAQMGRLMREIEFIERCADKRGIRL